MSDPAVEAAKRAWPWQPATQPSIPPLQLAEAAAREALAPIREMHRKEPGGHWPKCHECRYAWPCATAYLVYREDELQ